MVTVYREAGFRFAIYRNDHEPAHVHVIKDGEVIVNLVGPAGRPALREATRATKADVSKAIRIVTERQAMLLEKWKEVRDGAD